MRKKVSITCLYSIYICLVDNMWKENKQKEEEKKQKNPKQQYKN